MKKVLMAVCICFTFMLFVSSAAVAEKDIFITGTLQLSAMTVYNLIGTPCDVTGTLTPLDGQPGFPQVFNALQMTANGDALNLALLSELNAGTMVLVDVAVDINGGVIDVEILNMTVPVP